MYVTVTIRFTREGGVCGIVSHFNEVVLAVAGSV